MSDTVRYDDRTPRLFFLAAIVWAVVGMLVGTLIAAMLFLPSLNLAPYLTFGRLRPLHTNAVIFAFCGNIIFAGTYHSMQRLLKTRLFSDALSKFHFWGWQLLIVAAAVALVSGVTQAKEYAELPWLLDIVIAVLWVTFGINFFGTIAIRREKHLYVAIWFYIATIVAVAVLHIGNSMVIPYSWLGSYSAYSGVKDALMQWWYGHNAVAFFLTTPFLGLMYYYLPKAADRPVFSYRLSIMHFWSIVFVYIWAGPHHLHYSAVPEWASTLGMLFSLILWMPSWGGMVNGLFTLRGAWHKLREDPILKFMVVARHLLRHGHVRRADDVDQVGERGVALHRLDDRARARGGARLERLPLVRHSLLGRAAALEDRAVLEEARNGALLGRDRRPDPLPGVDVGGGHHAVGDVARLRTRWRAWPTPTSSRRSSGSCRCTGCASSGRSSSSRACSSWSGTS